MVSALSGADSIEAWRHRNVAHITNGLSKADYELTRNEDRVIVSCLRRVMDDASRQYISAIASHHAHPHIPVGRAAGPQLSAVMIKPVSDRCDLACTYCYEGQPGERYEPGRMTESVLAKVIEHSFASASDPVTFIWHGGEPLLAGLPFFHRAVELQKELSRGRPYRNSIQTNGVRVDGAWARLFVDNQITVGISLDVNRETHDCRRIDRRGRGTFDRVTNAIRFLHNAGVPVGVITVLGTEAAGSAREYVEMLLKLGVSTCDVHPAVNASGNAVTLPDIYAMFITRMFDYMLEHGVVIRVGQLDDGYRAMIGEPPAICYNRGACSSIIAVESDGSVVSCTRPFDRQRFTFGHIGDDDLVGCRRSNPAAEFEALDQHGQTLSALCPWHQLCHNGCPQHRFRNGEPSIDGANIYCGCVSGHSSGNARVWNHVFARVEEIISRW